MTLERHRRRRIAAFVAASLVAAATLLAVAPASATAPPGAPVSDPNPPGAATEATIVDLIDTGGLFGGTVPSASATTPYPSTGLQDQRSVTTAQLVLDDPATPARESILTYCIDISTDTTIGIHYRLGTWGAANVPNLDYVEWILNHYFPKVPTAPAGTASEKVRAVQGAIWYFTDRFVVSPFYPTERDAVRSIVEAAQTALAGTTPTTGPPLPALTITPATLTGGASGSLTGPYTVRGDVPSATIAITGTTVYRDAASTQPVPNGSAVVPGDRLWARYDATVAQQGFTLSAEATVAAGNVYLYDGNNPPRRTAQKLVLAADTLVPVRAAASIQRPDAGTLQVDVVVAGGAAGQQGRIQITATCEAGLPAPLTYTRYVPAGSAAGTYSFTSGGIPSVGTVCTVAQDSDGATAGIRVDTTIAPASSTLAPGATRVITVTDTYTADPGPGPGPGPTPAVLPATGTDGLPWLIAAAAMIAAGAALILRRRSGSRTRGRDPRGADGTPPDSPSSPASGSGR